MKIFFYSIPSVEASYNCLSTGHVVTLCRGRFEIVYLYDVRHLKTTPGTFWNQVTLPTINSHPSRLFLPQQSLFILQITLDEAIGKGNVPFDQL